MRLGVPTGTALTITKPDDFHHHFRDGDMMSGVVVKHAMQRFQRCLAMPNLNAPIVTTDLAMAYRRRILSAIGCSPRQQSRSSLEPLMTLYLTDETTPEEIEKAHATGCIPAVKYYPAGVTTNSHLGVTDIRNAYPALRAMAKCGMILCIHSEVSRPAVDIFDREVAFLNEIVTPLLADIPALKLVLEHISTREAVHYVIHAPDNVAATITCHHLLYNRNALLVGGIRPHYYCVPILKREEDRMALLRAASSSNPKFFAGTDSAPHETRTKESSCGCAGIYTAHAAIELYAEAFESIGALDRLNDFCGTHGAQFYNVPQNETTIQLIKTPWTVPTAYTIETKDNTDNNNNVNTVTPLRGGESVAWSIVPSSDDATTV